MTIPGFNRKQLHYVWQLIKLYWAGPDRVLAWTLLSIIISLTFFNIGMSWLFTKWNARFYNALEIKDIKAFYREGWMFIAMLGPSLVSLVIVRYTTGLLSFRWRRWLTHYYSEAWLDRGKHYKMRFDDDQMDNPDQRIAQDTHGFAHQVINLSLSLFQESLNFVCFVGMLWSLSGSWPLSCFGHQFKIPGYLVWVALLYVLIDTLATFIIGKPIIKLDYQQEQLEANFRYQLVRVREHSEEIASYKGEELEDSILKTSFEDIKTNFYQLLKQYIYLNTLQEFHKNFAIFFPIIMSASNFFSGMITLGTLMQIRQAFGHVQRSSSVLIFQYDNIAAWLATTKRLASFSEALDSQDIFKTTLKHKAAINEVRLERLHLTTPDGTLLRPEWTHLFSSGTHTLIRGRSGSGKSTLLRAVAGLWPYGSGAIAKPSSLMVIPQRAYLPLGNLKQCLCYPSLSEAFSTDTIIPYMQACRLSHLVPNLYHSADWSQRLSLGEQQRVAFVRILLHKPQWCLMDEPSSALDAHTEQTLFTLLRESLPNTSFITISHSEALVDYHDKIIDWEAL